MDEVERRMLAQLAVIEQVYGIKIQNRDDIILIASEKIDNPRQVLMICTSLKTWVAKNDKHGTVMIPEEVILSMIEGLS